MLPVLLKIVSISLMAATGWALKRSGRLSDVFTRELSVLLVNCIYPCLILSAILRNFTFASLAENWILPAGVAGILVIGWVIGQLFVKRLGHLPDETRRSFSLLAMANNYSFLPIMIVAALWGEKAVAQVSFASLGAELCIWTLGVRTICGGGRPECSFARNLLTMPILALAAAILILGTQTFLSPEGPLMTSSVLSMLLQTAHAMGQATIPIAAVICGARLAMIREGSLFSPLMAGICALRLILIPAICIGIFHFLPIPRDVANVLTVIAIQPCAMAAVSLAEVYRIDAHLASVAVLDTHLLCLLTIPLWLYLLGF